MGMRSSADLVNVFASHSLFPKSFRKGCMLLNLKRRPRVFGRNPIC